MIKIKKPSSNKKTRPASFQWIVFGLVYVSIYFLFIFHASPTQIIAARLSRPCVDTISSTTSEPSPACHALLQWVQSGW